MGQRFTMFYSKDISSVRWTTLLGCIIAGRYQGLKLGSFDRQFDTSFNHSGGRLSWHERQLPKATHLAKTSYTARPKVAEHKQDIDTGNIREWTGVTQCKKMSRNAASNCHSWNWIAVIPPGAGMRWCQ